MKKIVVIILLIVVGQSLSAQDTIRVGHKFRNFKNLEMGTKRDVIYSSLNGQMRSLLIKTRITELVKVEGTEYIKITHIWENADAAQKGQFVYYCEPETLKPVQHVRQTERAGKEAFYFKNDQIIGLDSAVDNSQAEFNLELTEPTYNWEIDLETYSLFPMKKGYKVAMNFYHPGSKTPPKFYLLEVTGSEQLKMADGSTLDCWVISTDYGGSQPTRFWYTKKGQNFVKMEGRYGQLKIHKERIY